MSTYNSYIYNIVIQKNIKITTNGFSVVLYNIKINAIAFYLNDNFLIVSTSDKGVHDMIINLMNNRKNYHEELPFLITYYDKTSKVTVDSHVRIKNYLFPTKFIELLLLANNLINLKELDDTIITKKKNIFIQKN